MNTFFVTMLNNVPQKTFSNLKSAKSAANPVPGTSVLEFQFSQDSESFYFVAVRHYVRTDSGSSCWSSQPTKGIKYRPKF